MRLKHYYSNLFQFYLGPYQPKYDYLVVKKCKKINLREFLYEDMVIKIELLVVVL